MLEQEALAVIGVRLPIMGLDRLNQVTPKIIEKLRKNRYMPFPSQRADDPAHPEHNLANATAYYVAMELEGESKGSNLLAGEVQSICMNDSSFAKMAQAAQALAVQADEAAYVAAIGGAVIATISNYAAIKAQAVFPKAAKA